MDKLLERFLQYVKFDTQSNDNSLSHPSTSGQMDLAIILANELRDLGLSNIRLDDKAYLMAELPSNTDKDVPTVGFIAHLDTSPEVSGKGVKPQVFYNYDGEDIVINRAERIMLTTNDNPELQDYIGQTIITSDGTTLLGADNKAGIAAIISALAHIISNPNLKHGKVVIAFTPDEEIGQGAEYFDVSAFGADFAFTIDGGPIGELEYETFNAAIAHIDIQGINVHPGTAYMRMKNALNIAMEIHNMLPPNERPEYTQHHEGFYHLTNLAGSVESAKISYIIRDHDKARFEDKKLYLQRCIEFINSKYGKATVKLMIKDQYYNMKEKIEPFFHIVTLAERAMHARGISPIIKPVRGGTDGAHLSFMGLPCPNIFTGGHNFHSRYEFISLESMEAASEVIIKIIQLIENEL